MQILQTNAAFIEVLGNAPTLFRPPFGDRDERGRLSRQASG